MASSSRRARRNSHTSNPSVASAAAAAAAAMAAAAASIDSPAANAARGASWPRNNWTEAETREVMEILVDEFIRSNYNTAAYSKSRAPDPRFDKLSFNRPSRELYNKVQNLRQRFFTPHGYLLRWASSETDARGLKRAEKGLTNSKTRESIYGIFASEVPASLLASGGQVVSDEGGISDLQQMAATEASSANNGAANNGTAVSEKSVNFYCDIFRRTAPDVWAASISAFKLFLSHPEYQSTGASGEGTGRRPGSNQEGKPRSRQRRQQQASDDYDHHMQDPQHLQGLMSYPPSVPLPNNAAVLDTPSTVLMTDFSSDFNSDVNDEGNELELVSVVGHSWHKFLCDRNRWASLGLSYRDNEDWERQEVSFLVRHLLTLFDCSFDNLEIPLTFVPAFSGALDSPSIEQAVNRSNSVRYVTLGSLDAELLQCLEHVDRKEQQYTMLSLCLLTDRASHLETALALLVSRGNSGQRFGAFPHNDPMFARLSVTAALSGSQTMWHEYNSQVLSQGVPMTPHQDEFSNLAFAYAQSGIKYSFFARKKGHFFEMTRDEEWAPTIMATQLRPHWSPSSVTSDVLLSTLKDDAQKILCGMVELFGLRPFCYGFFDGISAGTRGAGAAGGGGVRRISEDPSAGSRRRNQSITRVRKARASASAVPTASSAGGSPYALGAAHHQPYRRPQSLNSTGNHRSSSSSSNNNSMVLAAQAAVAAAATVNPSSYPDASTNAAVPLLSSINRPFGPGSRGNARRGYLDQGSLQRMSGSSSSTTHLPFMSPQTRSMNSFSRVSVSSMSLPNSPFFGFPMDSFAQSSAANPPTTSSGTQGQQHQQQLLSSSGGGNNGVGPHDSSAAHLFPSLSDATFAAASAVAGSSGVGFLTDPSLGGLANIAAAGPTTSLNDDAQGINMYPAPHSFGSTLAQFSDMQQHQAPPHSSSLDAVDTPPMGGFDATSLFSGVASTSLSQSSSAQLPGYWDMSSSGGNGGGMSAHQSSLSTTSMTPDMSRLGIPDASAIDGRSPSNMQLGFRSPIGLAGTAGAGAGAMGDEQGLSMGTAGSISSAEYTSFPLGTSISTSAPTINLYPPPTTANSAAQLALLEQQTGQPLASVMAGADMMMQFAQPSPTLTQYNLSAHATPSFDTCPVPSAQMQLGQLSSTLETMQTPTSASNTNPPSQDDNDLTASMAMYFGELSTSGGAMTVASSAPEPMAYASVSASELLSSRSLANGQPNA
ncbi:hypothetical protein GQ54DRAFT_299098 [Martensiomyces pterosporus]|nr:hypothetical protein GQ54DRAFT_299098 [Martensiomyces pterosporus]